jgi:DnaJ-domain-containing protein 1
MAEYHPDKVANLGSKLRELAEEEAKKINAAYEFFRTKYAQTV